MRLTAALTISLLAAVCASSVRAQPDSKITTNLGMGFTVPLNPTGQLIGSSVNVNAGIGYNITKRNSIIGQFMWAGLPVNKDAFNPIWIVAGARDISGSSNLFTLTANYRYRRSWKVFGFYLIGGGGWYYRRATISRQVDAGTATVCTPIWLYWGYSCVDGTVTQNQTLLSAGSTAFGGNGGAGFTIRINEEGYQFYVESRYHYAPTKNLATTFIPITIGISW